MSVNAAAPGTLFVVSAPSGAGKTSLLRALVERDRQIVISVSHATRDRRQGERDGDHYHFVDPDRFQTMCDEGAFLEHAEVFGNRYGTSRGAVQAQLDQGLDVVLEIDWQGARQIRALMPTCVSVFVLPPSLHNLRLRLESRAQDDAQTIDRRMRAAVQEITHFREYDFLVVNDRFQQALDELAAIATGLRLRQEPQAQRLAALTEELLAGERPS